MFSDFTEIERTLREAMRGIFTVVGSYPKALAIYDFVANKSDTGSKLPATMPV